MKLFWNILIISAYALMLSHCSSHLSMHGRVSAPAGVDSLVAVQADSITAFLFTDEKSKIKAAQWFTKAKLRLAEAESLFVNWQSISDSLLNQSDKDSPRNKLHQSMLKSIISAENAANRSIEYNPFDYNTRSLIAQAYFFHGQITGTDFYYKRSKEILKSIIQQEKGEHSLYFRLGESCYQLNDWNCAYENYKLAENVLLSTTFAEKYGNGNGHSSKNSVDHHAQFRYVSHQAIARARQYDNKNALILFKRAATMAVTATDSELVDNYIDWIQWDGGNIVTAEKKNHLMVLLKEKRYREARDGFEQLINELETQTAKDEINWRIALIEYEYLNQKEKACDRMHEIVRHISSVNMKNLPADSEYRQYASDAGAMFYKLGFDYKKLSQYKNAYRCFSTASDIEWYGKSKSLLELAKLSIHDATQTLDIVNEILKDDNDLNGQELLQVYTLKLNALKRFGRERLTEIQETYRQIKALQ
ncbi:hypothetical protein JW960_09755 [candidate division KSB1 bacterium]|nr:hypothetical protein [candidate division KSB1 bacterium]